MSVLKRSGFIWLLAGILMSLTGQIYLLRNQNLGPEQALYKEAYLYYTDTLIEKNYKPYQYRLIGINPFAELSPPSPVVVGMGRDKEAPPAPIMKDPKDVGGLLKISWEYKETPGDLKGFKIGKSPIVNGPFEFESDIVLPVTSREWIDKGTDAIGIVEFRIKTTLMTIIAEGNID
jgi:hypothetical protein